MDCGSVSAGKRPHVRAPDRDSSGPPIDPRGQEVPGHQIFPGPGRPHEPRPDNGTAFSRYDTHSDVWISNLRRVSHEDRIAEQGQGGAKPSGGPIHSRDDGYLQVKEIMNDFL